MTSLDALQGWYDARMGQPVNPALAALTPEYEAGYAWEFTQFVRDPCRTTAVVPRSWYGHDAKIQRQVREQLARDLPDSGLFKADNPAVGPRPRT